MATRSSVGTRDAEGNYKGRYVHSDGYPSGVGATVRALIERDGVETTRRVLIEDHYGWSTLDENQDEHLRGPGYDDGRFAAVPGYGVAYTTVNGQSSPDQWVTEDDDWGTEYAYVINDDGSVEDLDTVTRPWKAVS